MKPLRPLLRGGPAPLVPGRYKTLPEDFVVEELPAYAPADAGTHCFVLIEKRGLSTPDAVFQLARALGRREREFGWAGLKDAQAITRQWVSIEHADPERLRALSLEGVQVLEVRRHGNKLKLGHLRGNRFTIRLRGAGAEHLPALVTNLADLAARGAPNWFGEQRFGKRGANLGKGLAILLSADPRAAARTLPPHVFKLMVSAVQSEAFNRVLARRIASCDRLLPGDVAFLHRNGACFLVEDPAPEQARCAEFEISPAGPLPGPKCFAAQGEPAAIEAQVLGELGITPAHFGRMPRDTHEGARRPLRVALGAARAWADPDGLLLSFELPAGAYATAVLRELIEDAPWFTETRPDQPSTSSMT